MNNDDWLEEFKKALEEESKRPPKDRFDALVASGIIDEKGRVTGHLHRWDAYLAIINVTYDKDHQKIAVFHCRRPWAGMPGGEPRDLSRDALIEFMKQGRKIITARWDERLRMWLEGQVVHLLPTGFVRTDQAEEPADSLGNIPELTPVSNGQ